jgi:tetratricopeptide (TPR) repeat protein
VSAVPAEIAGIGATQQKLRVSPGFDPLKAALGPQEYFVLSRIDGQQTLRDVLLTTGLPVDRAIAIVQRLRAIGALMLPGEAAPPAGPGTPGRSDGGIPQPIPPSPTIKTTLPPVLNATAVPNATPPAHPPGTAYPPRSSIARTGPVPTLRPAAGPATGPVSGHPGPLAPARRPAAGNAPPAAASGPDPEHDLSLSGMTPAEMAGLREAIALDDAIRRRILAMARLSDGHDPWALLGVPAGSDARQLKRAYFKLSKEIHPDRYFGQQLGSFTARLPAVFEALSRAYARLTGTDRSSGAPHAAGAAGSAGNLAEQPQTPQEYAAELFERACQLEIGGDHLDAMKLFAAAVRVDPQPRYLRRAASCALAAGQPRSAVEYAKKAHSLTPNDPSSARLLAAAFRSTGKLSDAEEVLVMAMALKSENDVLTSELRHDLAEVRRLLAQSPS